MLVMAFGLESVPAGFIGLWNQSLGQLVVRGKHACRVFFGDLVRGTGDLIRDARRVDFSLSLFLVFCYTV